MIVSDSPLRDVASPSAAPAEYAAQLYNDYCSRATGDARRALGQFFTPVAVARFMAKLAVSAIDRTNIRLLEPGAGTAVLTAAICEQLPDGVESIHIDAYEIDPQLANCCEQTLHVTAAALGERRIRCTFSVHRDDFILVNADALTSNLFPSLRERYDVAVANPPYFKLQKADVRAQAASHIVHGQPNIYALFMAIMAGLLRPNGSMVTITPRSFTTGQYFRRFREVLFSMVVPEAIHLFESRRDAFRGDEVLQENVIVHARRRTAKETDQVFITSSGGLRDLDRPMQRVVPRCDVVDLGSRQLAVHLPTNELDEMVLKVVRSWPETLQTLGLRVSTGPVVAFRAKEFLRVGDANGEEVAPLLWLQNVKSMCLTWPAARTNKPQRIVDSSESAYLLLPNCSYVVMRRFSAKEEHRRLVAAPLIEGTLPGRMIGLENHLNYIRRSRQKMGRHEATGLAALLCSALVDRYFRISNGNTQVSAVELRQLPLPSREAIEAIGRTIESEPTALDRTIHDALHVPAKVRWELEQGANVEGC